MHVWYCHRQYVYDIALKAVGKISTTDMRIGNYFKRNDRSNVFSLFRFESESLWRPSNECKLDFFFDQFTLTVKMINSSLHWHFLLVLVLVFYKSLLFRSRFIMVSFVVSIPLRYGDKTYGFESSRYIFTIHCFVDRWFLQNSHCRFSCFAGKHKAKILCPWLHSHIRTWFWFRTFVGLYYFCALEFFLLVAPHGWCFFLLRNSR